MDYIGMNYILYFDYASLIVMVILLVSFCMIKHLDTIQNQILSVMLWGHLCVILMDIVNGLGPQWNIPGIHEILYMTHLIYFMVHNLTIFAFFFYCCCQVDFIFGRRLYIFALSFLPMVISFILMLSNAGNGWIFTVDENLVYRRGPMVLVVYLIAGVYVALSIALISVYRTKLTKLQLLVTYLYLLLCITGVAVQYFLPKLLVESFGMTVAMMLLFFTTAKFSDFYDQNFNVLNRQAFLHIVNSRINWLESSYIICLKVHDMQLYRLTMGKEFQEQLIRKIISYLYTEFPGANVFQYSNSEFVMIPKKKVKEKRISQVLDNIKEKFRETWQVGDNEIRCSFHVARFLYGVNEEISKPGQLREQLDYINNYSKIIENNVIETKDMKIGVAARKLLVQKLLREAVDHDGFEMYYQPIYSVREGKIISAEALIRLKNTDHGFISPEEFIPIAEQNGLIMRIGEFVFRSVCRFIKENNLGKFGIEFVEVNLSVVQCMQEKLHRQLLDIMGEYGVTPEQINLEITETAEATRMDAFQKNVFALTDEGIHFSLDDYGTGYSNINFLYKFPFNIVKIDKSLLWGAFENEKAMITLESSIEMAKRLNLEVVVEGVETEEHIELLKELGCEYLQGYYFSKPIPGKDFLQYVSSMVQA